MRINWKLSPHFQKLSSHFHGKMFRLFVSICILSICFLGMCLETGCFLRTRLEAGSNIPTGEIGHWRFDEASGNTIYDASGHGLNAILSGPDGGPKRVDGKFGGALEFNGKEYVNPAQHAVVHNTPAIDKLISGDKITVACWISTNDVTLVEQNPIEFYKNDDNNIHFRRIVLHRSPWKTWRLCLILNHKAQCKNISNGNNYTPDPNTWYHFVWTIDGTQHKLYIDNECKATANISKPVSNIGNGVGIYFGAVKGGRWAPWSGRIDQIRIYDRILNDAEIATLHNESLD